MKEKRIITRITTDLDPLPFGLDIVAVTEILVTHRQGYSENIRQEIAVLESVEQVY